MKAFYAYIRVSTVKQGERGVSLPEQRDAIQRYAVRHGLTISRWFEERQSAATTGRVGFEQMLRELERRKAAGVIIHKIDRSARNLHDWNEVTDLLERGFDVHVAHDAIDLKSRSGRLAGDIQAVIAADYIRNLRDEVRKGIYGRIKQGIWPGPAPIGYLDCGGGKPKALDPATAPLVRQLFERYSTGRFSLRQLANQARRDGLRSKTGKLLRQTQIAHILHNPFYTGIIRVTKAQQTFAGLHPALIPTAVFERVQQVLAGKMPRQAITHDFLFRRLLTCAHCGRSLIGELQKGRVYYRCQVPDCPTTSVRQDVAEAHLLALLSPLRFSPAHYAELVEAIGELGRDALKDQQEQRSALTLRLGQVQVRLDRLTDAYLDGALEKSELEQRKTALLMERRDLEDRLAEAPHGPAPADMLTDFLELANSAYLLYEKALPAERRELIEILTSNRIVSGRTPRFTLSSPFNELAPEAPKQTGGPSRSTARTRSTARRLLNSMSRYLAQPTAFKTNRRVHELLHSRIDTGSTAFAA